MLTNISLRQCSDCPHRVKVHVPESDQYDPGKTHHGPVDIVSDQPAPSQLWLFRMTPIVACPEYMI